MVVKLNKLLSSRKRSGNITFAQGSSSFKQTEGEVGKLSCDLANQNLNYL